MGLSVNRRTALNVGICSIAGFALGADSAKSKKKGFGIANEVTPAWREMLQRLNAGWFYTWGPIRPESPPTGIEFVPMMWGKWGCNSDQMGRVRAQGSKTLLGFNEPDQHDQANMSVDQALRLWPVLMDSGLRLGSPACVQTDGEWMRAFMREAARRDFRVDFVAMHSYAGADPKYFLNHVERIHALYEKPLWITEFAVADWNAGKGSPNRFSEDEILRFMDAVLPELEKLDYVERYAWFSVHDPLPALVSSNLFNPDGSLNRLGRLYASV